jgi:hypothetical protein
LEGLFREPLIAAVSRAQNIMALIRVIATVTGVAIFGMLLGAAFGWAAATIAPSFFSSIIPWKNIEPVGFATVLGAFGGVICGGGLGAFALILEAISSWRKRVKEG